RRGRGEGARPAADARCGGGGGGAAGGGRVKNVASLSDEPAQKPQLGPPPQVVRAQTVKPSGNILPHETVRVGNGSVAATLDENGLTGIETAAQQSQRLLDD